MKGTAADSPKVIKVGGASLGGCEDLRRVGAAVSREVDGRSLLVVVSALRGVTDLLERSLWEAAVEEAGVEGRVRRVGERLWQRHAVIAAGLGARGEVCQRLRKLVGEVEELLSTARLRGGLKRADQARLLTYGERLSAPLVALAIRNAGVEARAVSAEEIGLRGAGPVRQGRCLLEASAPAVGRAVDAAAGSVLVVTGFYGVGSAGDVILFGRGGSDYSAAALAALVDARQLELWKDVPGFYSANPKRVSEAALVPELTRAEASALGLYGARILHPRSLEPLRNRATEVWIGSPGEVRLGTRVADFPRQPGARVAALAVRAPRAVVRLCGASRAGIAGRIAELLEEVGRQGVQLDEVRVSAVSLCFSVVDEPPFEISRMVENLDGHPGCRISVRRSLPVIGIVGQDVGRSRRVRGILDDVAAGFGARATSVEQRNDGLVLQCRVAREALTPTLLGLHRAFFPETARVPVRRLSPP